MVVCHGVLPRDAVEHLVTFRPSIRLLWTDACVLRCYTPNGAVDRKCERKLRELVHQKRFQVVQTNEQQRRLFMEVQRMFLDRDGRVSLSMNKAVEFLKLAVPEATALSKD